MGMLVLANVDKALLILGSMLIDDSASVHKVVGMVAALLGGFSFGAMRQRKAAAEAQAMVIPAKALRARESAAGREGYLQVTMRLDPSTASIPCQCHASPAPPRPPLVAPLF